MTNYKIHTNNLFILHTFDDYSHALEPISHKHIFNDSVFFFNLWHI